MNPPTTDLVLGKIILFHLINLIYKKKKKPGKQDEKTSNEDAPGAVSLQTILALQKGFFFFFFFQFSISF